VNASSEPGRRGIQSLMRDDSEQLDRFNVSSLSHAIFSAGSCALRDQ
jgi:hypothetical protein